MIVKKFLPLMLLGIAMTASSIYLGFIMIDSANFLVNIDQLVYMYFNSISNESLGIIAYIMSYFGDSGFIVQVAAVSVIVLCFMKRFDLAGPMVISLFLVNFLTDALKEMFGRIGPNSLINESTDWSYPDGYVSRSVALYLSLAWAMYRLDFNKSIKKFSIISVIILPILVGLSTLYLGESWFSDIYGGVLLSAGIALFSVASINLIKNKFFSGGILACLVLFLLFPSINVEASNSICFKENLKIGSKGIDVILLQDFLVSKKLLVLDANSQKGYFDLVTQIALAKYQAIKKLTEFGAFGSITRDSVNKETCNQIDGVSTGIISNNLNLISRIPMANSSFKDFVFKISTSTLSLPEYTVVGLDDEELDSQYHTATSSIKTISSGTTTERVFVVTIRNINFASSTVVGVCAFLDKKDCSPKWILNMNEAPYIERLSRYLTGRGSQVYVYGRNLTASTSFYINSTKMRSVFINSNTVRISIPYFISSGKKTIHSTDGGLVGNSVLFKIKPISGSGGSSNGGDSGGSGGGGSGGSGGSGGCGGSGAYYNNENKFVNIWAQIGAIIESYASLFR